MEEQPGLPYFREVVIFLIAAGVIVPVFHRLRISPVLGYLIVGAIIGPFGLGLLAHDIPWLSYAVIRDIEGVKALAGLGVIFLLFMIGLELSLERLWTLRRLVFGLGTLQIVVTGAIIAFIALQFGNSPGASIVVGACLALSSTAIVMELLMHTHRLGTLLGRASFSILLMQDLAVVPILFMLGVFGAKGNENLALELSFALGKAVLAIGLIYALGQLALRPLLRVVAFSRIPETFMAAILLTVIGIAALAGAAGLSMALGAFLAGLLLAETEYRHEVQLFIEPFKGLMLGLFFMSVGMAIDLRVVLDEPLWIGASVIGLFALKAAVIAVLGMTFRLPSQVAVEAGLLMGQAGEFGFIVLGLAMSVGLLEPDVAHFMFIVTGMTMVATPFFAAVARRLAAAMEHKSAVRAQQGSLADIGEMEGHVIIAGFGRVGRTIAQILDTEGIPFLALDTDPAVVARAREDDLPAYYGDASRLDMLNRARIAQAQAIVITIDTATAAEKMISQIRTVAPAIPIYVRARDVEHADRLRAAGATVAVPEAVEASLQLAGRLLNGSGMPEDAVMLRLEEQRARELGYG
jgi:CPA2 family monovalent cation:H+ antiporter-2